MLSKFYFEFFMDVRVQTVLWMIVADLFAYWGFTNIGVSFLGLAICIVVGIYQKRFAAMQAEIAELRASQVQATTQS